MTQEQFEILNPMICSTYGVMGYNNYEALLMQGVFLSTHTFILQTLNPIEADVVKLRYGIKNQSPMKLQEVADVLEISLKQVKENELRALRKLRHPLRIKLLKQYTDDTIDTTLLERFNTQKGL